MSASEWPASSGQRLLWALARQRGEAALNCPVVCRLDGTVDAVRLRSAIDALVARHAALRTVVERRGRHLVQLVHTQAPSHFNQVDLRADVRVDETADAALREELVRPIPMDGFPVRTTLWTLSPRRHLLCLNVHHLASDAWSGAVQTRELSALYDDPAGKALAPPRVQYPEFATRQEAYFRDAAFQRDRAYWMSALDGARFDAVPLAALSSSAPRSTARRRVMLGDGGAARLQATASAMRSTPFTVLLAVYFVALARISGRADLSVASLFANRMQADLSETVGFLANLVVIRAAVTRGQSFRAVLQGVQERLREAFLHQRCPFHLLPADRPAIAGRRGDETVFQMLPRPFDSIRMGDVTATVIAPDGIDSRFDFEMTVVVEDDAFSVIAFWNRARLDADWVVSLLDEYRRVASLAVHAPDALV